MSDSPSIGQQIHFSAPLSWVDNSTGEDLYVGSFRVCGYVVDSELRYVCTGIKGERFAVNPPPDTAQKGARAACIQYLKTWISQLEGRYQPQTSPLSRKTKLEL